jgi:hypothetical protein
MNDGFVYKKWYRDMLAAYPKPVREEVNNAIIAYGLLEELISLKSLAWAAFQIIKADIDRDRDEEQRREAKSLHMRKLAERRWEKQKSVVHTNVNTDVYTDVNTHVCTSQNSVEATSPENPKPRAHDNNLQLSIPIQQEEKIDKEKETEKKNPLDKRMEVFYQSLIPYVERYGKEMVRHFFDFWSEPNKSRTKMRWELEPTFEINRRLSTWARRDKTFRNEDSRTSNQRIDEAIDIMRTLEAEGRDTS